MVAAPGQFIPFIPLQETDESNIFSPTKATHENQQHNLHLSLSIMLTLAITPTSKQETP